MSYLRLSSKYHHAAAMLSDEVTQIGCAVSQFVDKLDGKTFNASYLVCNYAGDKEGKV